MMGFAPLNPSYALSSTPFQISSGECPLNERAALGVKMSPRVLPNNSPLISKEIWTAAIVQHERTWDDDECEIYDAVRARSTDAIRRACFYYRVSRTLSSDDAVQLQLQ